MTGVQTCALPICIAISYILGYAKGHGITAHHIRQADTLEFAKAGTMKRELDKIFRD